MDSRIKEAHLNSMNHVGRKRKRKVTKAELLEINERWRVAYEDVVIKPLELPQALPQALPLALPQALAQALAQATPTPTTDGHDEEWHY